MTAVSAPDWADFRQNCPVTTRWIFLDHAAVAPLTTPAVRAMIHYAEDLSLNGIATIGPWADRTREVREHSARLLGANPSEIAFIPSTTMGIALVAEGFPFRSGDNLVTAAEEYPANQYAWMNLADRGVEVRRVPSRGNRIAVEDLEAAMDERTRLLTISAVEFTSGFRNDLVRLGEICRRRGIFFFVDAIQILGSIPFDVRQLPIDALAADGHKWLLGPEGAGIFWLRPEMLDRLHPIGVGANSVVRAYDFSVFGLNLKPHSGRYEGGAYNLSGITGLGTSIEMLLNAGIDHVRDRIFALTDYLCDRAGSVGLEVFSSRHPEERSGIVSVACPGRDPKQLAQRCRSAGIIINVRSDRLRISPHACNTEAELDQLLDVLKPSEAS